MNGKRALRFIIVLAVLVKIGFFLWGGVAPFQGADSHSFHSLALSVSKGEGLQYVDNGAPQMVLRSFRPPLYPLVVGDSFACLAVILRCFVNPDAARDRGLGCAVRADEAGFRHPRREMGRFAWRFLLDIDIF